MGGIAKTISRKAILQNLKPLLIALFGAKLAAPFHAQDTKYPPQGEQIPGPANPIEAKGPCCPQSGEEPIAVEAWKAWLKDVRHWRTEHLIRIGYGGGQYGRPELK